MIFADIDAQRRRAGLSVSELSRLAGVAYSTYWFIRTGRSKPSPRTLKRYEDALAKGTPRRPRGDFASHALTAYRGHVVAIAAKLGVDAAAVLASDPGRRAVRSAQWAQAAKVRALAIYCTAIEFDFRGATIARAIGMTKQAVSWNLKRVEDWRDDPRIDSIIEEAGKLINKRESGT